MAIVLRTQTTRLKIFDRSEAVKDADPATYREFVFRCALAVCGEPDGAEDVSQEVLLILHRSRSQVSQLENPTAWIRKVTVRVATRFLKRQRRPDPLPETFGTSAPTADALTVYQVLKRLSPEQRALLGMAMSQGLSYREIGETLDIPEGTVASRLYAAKKAFQKEWENE